MKYKVGDRFITEIARIEKETPYPYIMKNGEPYDVCGLDTLEQITDGMDTDSYNEGAKDAWELAKLITIYTSDGGLSTNDLIEIFGTDSRNSIFTKNTYEKANAKFEAWEKSKVGIEVGDLVYVTNAKRGNGIVSRVDGDWRTVIWSDGSSGNWLINDLTKTGESHADEVAALIGLLK